MHTCNVKSVLVCALLIIFALLIVIYSRGIVLLVLSISDIQISNSIVNSKQYSVSIRHYKCLGVCPKLPSHAHMRRQFFFYFSSSLIESISYINAHSVWHYSTLSYLTLSPLVRKESILLWSLHRVPRIRELHRIERNQRTHFIDLENTFTFYALCLVFKG